MSKIKYGLSIIAFIVAFVIAKYVVGFGIKSYYESKDKPNFNQILLETVNELNNNLPMMIDSETRLDNAVGFNKILRYNNTLINYTANEISANDLFNALDTKITNSVCTSVEMQVFLDNDITINYAYSGKNGKYIMVIEITKSKCLNI